MSDVNGTYYYLADANKNIGQLLNSSGYIVAKYEYSPFGKLTVNNDSVNNPFRFSSEYFDDETGLIYYNFRYYSPTIGRWLSRDPIEEQGGYNLHTFIYNSPINKIDVLGFSAICDYLNAAIQAINNNLQKAKDTLAKIDAMILNQMLTNANADFLTEAGFYTYSTATVGGAAAAGAGIRGALAAMAKSATKNRIAGTTDIVATSGFLTSKGVIPKIYDSINELLLQKEQAESLANEALSLLENYKNQLKANCCE